MLTVINPKSWWFSPKKDCICVARFALSVALCTILCFLHSGSHNLCVALFVALCVLPSGSHNLCVAIVLPNVVCFPVCVVEWITQPVSCPAYSRVCVTHYFAECVCYIVCCRLFVTQCFRVCSVCCPFCAAEEGSPLQCRGREEAV